MALPPPKPPAKPGLAPAAAKEDALARSRREKDELEKDVQGAEEELEALKARYDQYFLGIERREPNRWRDELKKKVLRLKSAFTRNTGLRFRIESLHARFLSYERLWLRSAREKEEGTYRRDLFKARLHRQDAAAGAGAKGASGKEPTAKEAGAKEREPAAAEPSATETAAPGIAAPEQAAAPAKPAATAGPARPAATAAPPPPLASPMPAPAAVAARPPPLPAPPPSGGGAMSETQMRALYSAYLAAKMTCREDVSKLTYEAVARTVTKQLPELMTRYKAKSVEFKVEVKDGRAILKAIPKV